MQATPLSNEDKTLEEITSGKGPAPQLEVDEPTRALLAGIMVTIGLGEMRIRDRHLEGRHQLEVKRDIHQRCTVITLVGAAG
jgi:hypothetical protein